MNGLERFEEAQKKNWTTIMSEMKRGYKKTSWMRYVFPVMKSTEYSNEYYCFSDLNEVEAFLENEYLIGNMTEIINILMSSEANDPYGIFSFVDAEKLQASMTLLYKKSENEMFLNIINKFFNGELDDATLNILKDKM